MAGTYKGVLACSAGPLRHGILDTFLNCKEKANYATFFPELLSKLEALLDILCLKKLWKTQLLGICFVRMNPKPSQSGSAFCQKAIKIQAWKHQHRSLEGSGASLEASWAILGHPGRLWKYLGPSWKRLGGALEASWAVLGRKRWPTWLQGSSQNGGQIYKKST